MTSSGVVDVVPAFQIAMDFAELRPEQVAFLRSMGNPLTLWMQYGYDSWEYPKGAFHRKAFELALKPLP